MTARQTDAVLSRATSQSNWFFFGTSGASLGPLLREVDAAEASLDRAQGRRSMRLTGADPFTLLFAEAVHAPRVGMIVPRIMLAQQVLAVVVAVRSAHDRVDMIARGFVVRIDDSWLVVEFDEHDWTVDAVVEGAVVVVRANPGKVRVAQVIERLLEPDFRMARAQAMQVDADQIA